MTDVELIARAKAQDPQALTELVRTCDALVHSVALRLIGNHADASDIRQQTMVRMCQAIGAFDEQATFSTWLYRIVVNVCRDHLRQRERQRRGMKRLAQVESATTANAPPSPGDERATGDAVARAVGALPPAEREAIILRHYANLTFGEMGTVLDVPVSTLKSRVLRALERLRVSLTRIETVAD